MPVNEPGDHFPITAEIQASLEPFESITNRRVTAYDVVKVGIAKHDLDFLAAPEKFRPPE